MVQYARHADGAGVPGICEASLHSTLLARKQPNPPRI
jgi:hypothetical protein